MVYKTVLGTLCLCRGLVSNGRVVSKDHYKDFQQLEMGDIVSQLLETNIKSVLHLHIEKSDY